MSKKLKRTRWSSCNVLQYSETESRHLWIFDAGKNGFALDRDQVVPVGSPLPAKVVARDWKDLIQPKLNLALLPFDKVFLRVIQLPVSEFNETVAMVELQMEKLSPLPVTQVVWSVHVLPHTVDNLQSVIVIIAARDFIEPLLGRLEAQGYQPDRLELPILDQLLATPITGDGAWLYPAAGTDSHAALVAWWYGGVLRHLGLLNVPVGADSAELLKEQLTHMAWAGELEGWLALAPHWHLVASEVAVVTWQPLFRSWLGQPAEVIAPLSEAELAALTANRAARAESRATILPVEFSDRYRSQFVDRLWMRGLGTLLTLYLGGVMVYFAALSIQRYHADDLDHQTASLNGQYTNVMRLKNQLQILRDREALKFASLNCWKITAELLPAGFTIQSLDFKDGKSFRIHGSAPQELAPQVPTFGDALRKYHDGRRPALLLEDGTAADHRRGRRDGGMGLQRGIGAGGGNPMKKFWDQLKSTERRWVIAIGCVVFVVLNYFFVWPRFREWHANSVRIEDANAKIKMYRTEVAKQSDYQKAINELDSTGMQGIPPEDQTLKFAQFYQGRATENGVQIQSEIQRAGRTNEYFMEQQATIDVVAGEKNLVGFLYSLGSSSSLMRVREMSLHAVEPNRYQLRAQLTIVASYQKKALPAKPAAPKAAAAKPAAGAKPVDNASVARGASGTASPTATKLDNAKPPGPAAKPNANTQTNKPGPLKH